MPAESIRLRNPYVGPLNFLQTRFGTVAEGEGRELEDRIRQTAGSASEPQPSFRPWLLHDFRMNLRRKAVAAAAALKALRAGSNHGSS
jgi:hypothetical protein